MQWLSRGVRRTGLVAAAATGAIALGAAGTSGSSPAPPGADRFDTVVIDAGHGGEDMGARGADGTLEKELALDVARRLSKMLRSRELQVVMTRDGDQLVPLETRMAIANDARGDLFVSIHANASSDARIRGSEIFYRASRASDEAAAQVADRENAAFGDRSAARDLSRDPVLDVIGDMITNEYKSESSVFAKMAEQRLRGIRSTSSRGVKQAPFVVLTDVQMPSILVEVGFITNSEDVAMLRTDGTRDEISRAIADAVIEFARRHDFKRGLGAAMPGPGH